MVLDPRDARPQQTTRASTNVTEPNGRPRPKPSRRKGPQIPGLGLALAGLVTAIALVGAPPGFARETAPSGPTVDLQELPREAQVTHRRILAGGPFPYSKDGTTFFNRERLLPRAPRGFYREYTVRTPGASNRGARRIVCGGEPPTRPEACYYTADHYASFRRINP